MTAPLFPTDQTFDVPYWGGTNSLPLDPSDPKVTSTFSTGQCHSLAVALHRITGWTLVLLCEDADEPESWHHAVVETPWGTFVDIDGEWSPDDADEAGHWYGLDAVGVPDEDRMFGVIAGTCDRLDPESAMPFAFAVLDEYGIPYVDMTADGTLGLLPA